MTIRSPIWPRAASSVTVPTWSSRPAPTAHRQDRRCRLPPDGPRVIESVENGLGLPDDALNRTRKALRDNGTLSSAAVLDVLCDNLADPPPAGSIGLMIAMGPAFCSELVLLRW